MNKTLKKILIAIGCVLGGFFALFLLLYAVLAVIGCAMYGEYRAKREFVCIIPELSSGVAPQGVTYGAERDVYLLTGYDGAGMTVMHAVRGNEFERVELLGADGQPLVGHAGGVTCTKDRVYVANDGKLYMYSLADITEADGAGVELVYTFAVDNNASFCFSNDEYLFVGEFYRKENYPTSETHRYVTPSGDDNRAIVSCYKLDETGLLAEAGVQPYPEYVISIGGLVQGFATDGRTFMLSKSYGLKNSTLEYHRAPTLMSEMHTVTFENASDAAREVPLYCLDRETLIDTLVMPAFSEDLTVVGDRVVVTNESSANKYIVGKFFGANKVYSLPIVHE